LSWGWKWFAANFCGIFSVSLVAVAHSVFPKYFSAFLVAMTVGEDFENRRMLDLDFWIQKTSYE
jgi:hypothetical protein